MKLSSKILLVVAGYVVAFMVAALVVSIYVATTNGPDRQTYSGMFAFGDSLLFLGVFGLAAIPATGAALFFLRPFHWLWRILSFGALGVATTGIAALADYLVPRNADTGSFLGAWSSLSPIRFLLAPLLAVAFFLSFLFAPTRATRIAFLGATGIETVVLYGLLSYGSAHFDSP